MNKIYFLIITAVFIGSCGGSNKQDKRVKLLFKSGFEKDVYIDNKVVENSEDYKYIRGKDI